MDSRFHDRALTFDMLLLDKESQPERHNVKCDSEALYAGRQTKMGRKSTLPGV
jgi:hypothetical protein